MASGKGLRVAGVNVDLAPVGDLSGEGSFMAREQRTFASPSAVVTEATVAFAPGLVAEQVAAAVKHFPGIGRATRNTHRSAVEIAATRAEIMRSDLLPSRSAIGVGIPIVMISNATYAALDPEPAPWSTKIQSLLRCELRFRGVTITYALDDAAASGGTNAAVCRRAGGHRPAAPGRKRGASSAAAFERVVRSC